MAVSFCTVGDALEWAINSLNSAGIKNPKLNAEILLCNILRLDKTHLYMDIGRTINADAKKAFEDAILRRSRCEPIQYITNKADFFGKEFYVESGVLIPRPETELLVESCLAFLRKQNSTKETFNILDLCTGSGCIAISIACELYKDGLPANIMATDISKKAIEIAKINALKHGVKNVEFLLGDLDQPVATLYPELVGKLDLIVSNPPYVPAKIMKKLPTEVIDFEPETALCGGWDGLDLFNKIADFSSSALNPGGMLAVELFEDALNCAKDYLENLKFCNIKLNKDMAGKPRYITALKI